MNPQLLAGIGVVILLAITHTFAFIKGEAIKDTEWKAKTFEQLAKDSQAAREQQTTWQGAADAIVKNLEAKRAGVQRNLDIALNGLRDRPERHLPNDPGTNCKGATGAELSRPDAIFLTREAARGVRLQTALEACYKYADTLKKK